MTAWSIGLAHCDSSRQTELPHPLHAAPLFVCHITETPARKPTVDAAGAPAAGGAAGHADGAATVSQPCGGLSLDYAHRGSNSGYGAGHCKSC